MWGDTLNSDVGVVWMFISVLFFLLGIWVGAKIRDTEEKAEKKPPTDEEIRVVLENVMFSYHCSPHEKDCIEEAINILDERIGDNEA